MRMFCLSPTDITTETIWSDMEPLLSRFAAATGETWPEQIREGVAQELLQLWGLQDAERVRAVTVTELSDTPRGLLCTIRVAATDDSVPAPIQERLLDAIGAWAREKGCVALRIVGRKGWLRRFPRFKQTAVVMECAL